MATPWDLIKNGQKIDFAPPFSSILTCLEYFAKKNPEKKAIIFDDFDNGNITSLSYKELLTLVKQTASFLEKHLGNEKTFAYVFSNRPEILILNLAAMISGKIFVPMEVKRDNLEQKTYKLKLTGAKLLFLPAENKEEQEQLRQAIPDLQVIETEDFADFQKKLESFPTEIAYKTNLEDDCLVLFTSGTTNLPKGVRLTFKSLLANADSIANWLKFDAHDRFNILLPLHHINSITFSLTTIISGATIVLSSRYSKSHFWQTLAKHSCTGASIVPTIAYDLSSETESFAQYKNNLSQIRRFQIGSAPVNPQVVEKFMDQYQIQLIQGYGQTETSLRSTGVPMDLSQKDYQEATALNTVGKELKWTNVTVLREDGTEANEGENGEICVRGPIITPGYLDNPEANKKAFAYSWFHSGDRGYFKMLFGEKYFFLTGRVEEIIKKGGVLISPLSIENTLLKNYPDLKQVFVVGFPDPRLGEEVGFVSIADEKTVNRVLEDARLGKIKNLSDYETPKAGLSVSKEELPKTSTGKVMRAKIKELSGQKLLENSRTITVSGDLSFRLIKPEEEESLAAAAKINNQAWGKDLFSDLNEFTARSANGILIGAFDSKSKLHGSVSALKTTLGEIERSRTWAEVTGGGTLNSNNHKGDILLCVAISTPSNKTHDPKPIPKEKLTEKGFEQYINSDQDYVIRFHRKPKAGFPEGASLIKILPHFRPEDKDALGFNVLMKYPELDKKPRVSSEGSTGTKLIEAALLYGFYQNIKNVYVLTRPAQASEYFKKI